MNEAPIEPIRQSPPIVLRLRTIYIVPSKDGFFFGALVMVMLLGSLNYANTMGLILTFFLIGLGLVAMVHTYRNLGGIALRAADATPVFAGQEAMFPIYLRELIGRPRWAINFNCGRGMGVITDLMPGEETSSIFLAVPALQRGDLPLGKVTISTTYPLGLFYAWSVLDFATTCLVYPAPAPRRLPPPPPKPTDNSDEGATPTQRGAEDLAGFRSYQPGDPLRRIHWRAMAREGGLHTILFSGLNNQELWLDWDFLAGLDIESRLSQLCRWILDADQSGNRYGLRLPNHTLAPGQGVGQRHRCLEALARY